ncbi:MAG: O-sialoglycoprotein endopeptidase [Bacillota bacterium]|nr:O-sialoglycoprotein endopeptidase [Bacillota bacterium]
MEKNHKQSLYLGIDTSAYTSSLAIADQNEKLLYDGRFALAVKEGNLGLRQSEAVFAHIQNMPTLFKAERAQKVLKHGIIHAVASAARPRPVEGSYMPVFKVGEAFGLMLTQAAGFNYFSSTHQEGHIFSGLWSAGLGGGRYLVVHLSGGTTEIIDAEETSPGVLKIKLLGGSEDLKAGQFIDRIGRLLNLKFPAGPELEKVASLCEKTSITLPVAVRGNKISFSGPASQAERLLENGCNKEALARAVEICIADSLSTAVNNLKNSPDAYNGLLAVGGVAANRFIRQRLQSKLAGWKIYFAEPRFSSDNAVGLAVQAARLEKSSE